MEENFRDCKTEDDTKYDGERDFERLKSLGREARVVTDDQIICGIIDSGSWNEREDAAQQIYGRGIAADDSGSPGEHGQDEGCNERSQHRT